MAKFSRMTLAALFVSPCLARLAARTEALSQNGSFGGVPSSSHPGSGFRKTAQEVLDKLRIIAIAPQARLSIFERKVGYA